MTVARFTVQGRYKRELESRAIEVISELFGPDAGGTTFDLDVSPLVQKFGEDKPALWHAEVVARHPA